jgi:hypothetical protein
MSASDRRNFHGDPARFPVLLDLITERFGSEVRYIADVAGGQGMLSRLLRKKNYDAEVIDPRGWRLRGVPGQENEFNPAQASYYDLVVGLHPDEATRAVAISALYTRTLLVPCCNFWDRTTRLGTLSLVEAIEAFYRAHQVKFERIELALDTPKRVALITTPPSDPPDLGSIKLPHSEVVASNNRDRAGWLEERKARRL